MGMAHAGGRPSLYTDIGELDKAIEQYFTECDGRIVDVVIARTGEIIKVNKPEPYTMAGLAYYLHMDRRTLLDYSKKGEFSPSIKAAKQLVQLDVERRLMEDNATGAIFNLKNNFEYADKTETDITTKGEQINTGPDSVAASSYAAFLKGQK